MVYQFILENLTWWTIIVIVGLFFVFNPTKLDYWIALITRGFASVSRFADRKTVSSEIQSKLHNFVLKYNLNDILPYGIKFKWVTGKNFDSYVTDGEVFVFLEDYQNTTKNFVRAIDSYISKGFLPKIRAYIPKKILTSSELIIQEKIILDQRPDAHDYFINYI